MPLAIDKVFVINLDRSPQRLETVGAHLKKEGVRFERFAAIDGAAISHEDARDGLSPWCRQFCSAGMKGCGLSHLHLWRRIASSEHRAVLILEDDVELAPDFLCRLNRVLAKVSDFDILFAGCNGLCASSSPSDEDTVFEPTFPLGTHAYVLTPAGAARLLEATGDTVSYHIDMQLAIQRWQRGLKVFAVHPDLAKQRDTGESTITSYSFPTSLNYLLNVLLGDTETTDRKRHRAAYYACVPLFSVLSVPITPWHLAFLLAGLLSKGAIIAAAVAVLVACEIAIAASMYRARRNPSPEPALTAALSCLALFGAGRLAQNYFLSP